ANAYGLQAVPLGQGNENIFLGLAGTNSTDGKSVIPFLQADKEAFLEYDIAKLIQELRTPKKPVVGIMSSLPMVFDIDPTLASMPDPWAMEQQLRQLFDVKGVDPTSLKSVAPDINVLIVLHPKALSDDAQYAIDQFLMRGGRLLVFVDPHAEAELARGDP